MGDPYEQSSYRIMNPGLQIIMISNIYKTNCIIHTSIDAQVSVV